jgi:hypothetical protein
MLANTAFLQVTQTTQQAYLISDHDLLTTHIPLHNITAPTITRDPTHNQPAHAPATAPLHSPDLQPTSPPETRHRPVNNTPKPSKRMYCKWIEGSSLADYNKNAKIWQDHTSTEEFAITF